MKKQTAVKQLIAGNPVPEHGFGTSRAFLGVVVAVKCLLKPCCSSPMCTNLRRRWARHGLRLHATGLHGQLLGCRKGAQFAGLTSLEMISKETEE